MGAVKKRSLATLRFLNLLEPGRVVLSITNVAMWLSVVGLSIAVFTNRALDLPTISTFFVTSSLYAFKRFVLWKTGKVPTDEPYIPTPLPPAQ